MFSDLSRPDPSSSRSRTGTDDLVVDSNGAHQSVHSQARALLAGPVYHAATPRRPLVDVNGHAVSLGSVERDGSGMVRSITLVRVGVPQSPFRYVAKRRDSDAVEAVVTALREFARHHPAPVARGDERLR